MIARIESNCTTGEVKYFDENEVEISIDQAKKSLLTELSAESGQ
jgi:hypothetical protein